MAFERFVAGKFMLRGTEEGRFSAMTVFAWLTLGVGVAAMGSLLSVMYGFEAALKSRVLEAYPHVLVKQAKGTVPIRDYQAQTDAIRKAPGVVRVTPYLETEMVVQSSTRSLGGVLQGLPESVLRSKTALIDSGVLPDPSGDVAQAMIGKFIAGRLDVRPGDNVRIVSPVETSGMMGLTPRSQSFEVTALFKSGHYQFDEQYLYLLLSDVQDLIKKGDVISGWQVWGESYESASTLQKSVQGVLRSGLVAESWSVFNSALFSALQLEQLAMFIIFSFAIAIAVLNIGITLMMYVVHKRKNIGILRALGASKQQVHRIFPWQGYWIGGTGLLLGVVLTVIVMGVLLLFEPQLPEIYYDRSIPIEVRPWSMVGIYLIAIVMIFLSTLYPAKKAMETHPIEAIRQ